jgi:hypothetical protein
MRYLEKAISFLKVYYLEIELYEIKINNHRKIVITEGLILLPQN